MQPVCQQCGRLVAVNQIFCGNCGTKLNAAELDGPTEHLDESWPQQPSGRLLPGSPFSYPGGTNAAPLDFYTATLDGRDHSGTSTFPSDPYGTLWYDASGPQTQPPPVSAPAHPHVPVTTFPGSRAVPNSYNSHNFVPQQQKMQVPAPNGTRHKQVSRRRALRVLGGLSVFAAAGLGAGLVIASENKASAGGRTVASPTARPTRAAQPQLKQTSMYTYTGHHAPVYGLIWEPVPASSQVFRVASCSNNVQLWDAFNGGNARTYQTAHGQVFSLSWCHSTFKIVSGNADGTADIWIASQTQFVNRLSGHNAAIRGVSWAKNGIHVATASDDTRVGLWPLDTQHNDRATPIFLQGHRKSVYTVSFSEDASPYLVSGSADGTAILWQVKQTTPLATYAGHQGDVRTVVFAPGSSQSSGLRIASGGADQTAQVWTWDPAGKTLPQIARYTGHHATINSLAWSPDGQRIASGDSSGQVHIWHSQTGVQLLTFQAHQAGVSSLGWAPNGQHLASAGLDGVAHIVQIS